VDGAGGGSAKQLPETVRATIVTSSLMRYLLALSSFGFPLTPLLCGNLCRKSFTEAFAYVPVTDVLSMLEDGNLRWISLINLSFMTYLWTAGWNGLRLVVGGGGAGGAFVVLPAPPHQIQPMISRSLSVSK
jgi:hypothetical protein